MFIEEIKNIKSGKKELREFGIVMSIAMNFADLLLFWKRGEVFIPLVIFSALFLFLGLFGHRLLRPIYKIWMTISLIMGRVVSALILAILFYLIFTPIGLIAKLFHKDFLDLKFGSPQGSYWLKRDESKKSFYEKQS